jgi:hypothetical protein
MSSPAMGLSLNIKEGMQSLQLKSIFYPDIKMLGFANSAQPTADLIKPYTY